MILEERTRIVAEPDAIFAFFANMEDNYTVWHPDHVTFRWLTGDGLEDGARAYFEEYVAGEHQKKAVRFTSVVPNRHIAFEPIGFLTRLLLPEISFTIEPVDEAACRFTQRLRVRTGPIGAWLNRREFDAVRQHMHEEGVNLKAIFEDRD